MRRELTIEEVIKYSRMVATDYTNHPAYVAKIAPLLLTRLCNALERYMKTEE